MFSYFFHSVLCRDSLEVNCQIEILTKTNKISGRFQVLCSAELGLPWGFSLQGCYIDNSLIFHAQVFKFWRAKRTFTQTDSLIPTLWNWSCPHCDTVNRMLLTLASLCQSVREGKLSCQLVSCLPPMSFKQFFDPWLVKGKVLHQSHPGQAHPGSVCSAQQTWGVSFTQVPVSLGLAVSTDFPRHSVSCHPPSWWVLWGASWMPPLVLELLGVCMHLLLRHLYSFSQWYPNWWRKKK